MKAPALTVLIILIICHWGSATNAIAQNPEVESKRLEHKVDSLQGAKHHAFRGTLIKAEPTATGKVIGEIPDGGNFLVYDSTGIYYKIKYRDLTGWASMRWTVKGWPDSTNDNSLPGASNSSSRTKPVPLIKQKTSRSCCKICRKGKACGNSCIARNKTCHKSGGCACNG